MPTQHRSRGKALCAPLIVAIASALLMGATPSADAAAPKTSRANVTLTQRAINTADISMSHASLRFDRSKTQARSAVQKYRQAASILTLTEVHNRRSVYAQDGWGAVVAADSAVTWDQSIWRNVGSRTQYYHGFSGGKSLTPGVPMVALEHRFTRARVLVASVHTPATVEAIFSSAHPRVQTYKYVIKAMKADTEAAAKAFKAEAIAVGGDWNLNIHRDWVRAYMKSSLPGWTTQWDKSRPNAGTHAGGRLIDAVIGKGVTFRAGKVLPSHPSSDHRAITAPFRMNVTRSETQRILKRQAVHARTSAAQAKCQSQKSAPARKLCLAKV